MTSDNGQGRTGQLIEQAAEPRRESGAGVEGGRATASRTSGAVFRGSDGVEQFAFRPHNCFACGELNVHGLRLKLHLESERCWTELAIPRRFEGWEGIVHGGILCTILDEVMAWSLVAHDNWGVTARMSVDFRRPVTVDQPIRAEGWVTEARRRVQRTAGRIVDAQGVELAVAEATYVAASDQRKQELKDRYGFAGPVLPADGDRSDENARLRSSGSYGRRDAAGAPEGALPGTREAAGDAQGAGSGLADAGSGLADTGSGLVDAGSDPSANAWGRARG